MMATDARMEDTRAALQILLDNPTVSAASDPDAHERVRRNLTPLNRWFSEHAGWWIDSHPQFMRLVRATGRAEPSHRSAWARDRRSYELLCWCLWFGEHTAGRKFTISQLADAIREKSRSLGEKGQFDWKNRNERYRLVRVLNALDEMGALRIQDGSTTEWGSDEGKRDALCEWGALAWQLNVPFGAEHLNRLAEGEAEDVEDPGGHEASPGCVRTVSSSLARRSSAGRIRKPTSM
jgi:uncharacterized protein (TIGR02678 family)